MKRSLVAAAIATVAALAHGADASAATSEIEVRDNFFAPAEVDVTVGDTVRWTFDANDSDHTVTLVPQAGGATVVDEQVAPDDPPLDYVTTTAGRYVLLCQIHSPMRGRVDVLAPTEPSPPVTGATFAPTAPGDGGTYGGPVQLSLGAADDSGVASTELRINGGGFQSYAAPLAFDTEGPRTVEFRSTDIAGNVETLRSVSFTVDDATAPVTTHEFGPPVGGPATITLSAADADGLGVASTEHRLDGAAFTAYTGPIRVAAPGAHTIEYRSTDRAGNVEQTRSATFDVQSLAPPVGASLALASPPKKVKAKALAPGLEVAVVCAGTAAGEAGIWPRARSDAKKLGLKPGKPLATAELPPCANGAAQALLDPEGKPAKALGKLAGSAGAVLKVGSGALSDSAQLTIKGRRS